MNKDRSVITIATRGSALALAQAEIVKRKLEALEAVRDAGKRVELRTVQTRGDRDRATPLREIGSDGVFVREIERTVLAGEADLAVHSAKDLPFALAKGLAIGGIPDAADPRDLILWSEAGRARSGGGASPRIGSGSPRREAEYRAICPGALFAPLRGNVGTRIRKLRDGEYDAVILAKAGVDRLTDVSFFGETDAARLDLSGLHIQIFSPGEMIPAPCQGILAAQCREEDAETMALLRGITDPEAEARFRIEREVLGRFGADCRTAVGAYAQMRGENLTLYALLGKKRAILEGKRADAERLVREITEELCR